MRRPAMLACVLLFGSLLWAAPPLHADDGIPIDEGAENECLDLVPKLPANPTSGRLRADIVVALDGVSKSYARKIMARAAQPYVAGPVPVSPDVTLKVIAYHDLTKVLRKAPGLVSAGVVNENPQGTDLMSRLIDYYNSNYPDLRRDHVELFTSKDLYIDVNGQKQTAVLGITNCLGSVGTKYSYTITEANVLSYPIAIGPLNAYTDLDAKTVAHEIGHTFGAQHHYAICGLAAASLLDGRPDVCTLMANFADFIALQFGPTEVAAIRGHAESQLKH